MLKVLVVDDEVKSRTTLVNFLNKYCADKISLAGEAGGVKEAAALIKERSPDILLLDINMGDGTGFDLLDKVENTSVKVIFTTAYNEYAIKAFKYNAVDYLLKPIDPDDLKKAIDKAVSNNVSSSNNNLDQLRSLGENFTSKGMTKIMIQDSKGITFINKEDVLYIKSDNNYSVFFLTNKTQIVASRTLGDFEDLLCGKEFCRIHNTCIVNIKHIQRYIRGEGGFVVMTDNSQHEVSRRKKSEFIELLQN